MKPCPKCGSDNIQKLTVYDDKKHVVGGGSGMGCVTCLLIVIIFILAPILVVGPLAIGTALGIVAVVKFWPYIVGFLCFLLLLSIINAINKSNKYICLRCGKKFRVWKGDYT